MKILAWIVLAIIILIILALMLYLSVGAILFGKVFKRKNLADRLMKKNLEKQLKEYKIDLCWWDKFKFVKVKTQSFDQLNLVGHFFEANSDETVIVVHGFGSDYREMQQYCKFFLEKNFNVLAVSNRGHGESEGKFVGFGWLDRKDILSWVEFLNKKQPENKIVLFGLSMGGTAVCSVAGEKLPQNVVAIISDCAFANADKQIMHVIRNSIFLKGLKKLLYSFAKRVHGFDIKEIDATKQVKITKIPILYFHGNADDFVPVENLFVLYGATPENLRDKMIVEGAGHALAYPVAGVLYEKKISDFLKSRTLLK